MFSRIATLSLGAKALLAFAVLLALGLAIVLSPFMIIVALVVLIIATFAIIYRALRRRPTRNWGIVALTSLFLIIVFAGVSEALYGDGAPQQASSPSEPKKAAEQQQEPSARKAQKEADVKKADSESAASPSKKDDTQKDDTQKDDSESAASPSEPTKEAQAERDRYDATVRVTGVVDGDTIKISPAVDGKYTVRLIGVDTPETKDPACAVQPYGLEASEFTESQLEGQEVALEFDKDRTDRYQRLLAYVYEDGEMFNKRLLREGYARVETVQPNTRYVGRFEVAEAEAQSALLGVWSLSPEQIAAFLSGTCSPPQQPPAQQPPEPEPSLQQPQEPSLDSPSGSVAPNPDGSCPSNAPIKGNAQSGIYHTPGKQSFGKTRAEECFASELAAKAAGYRGAKK